MMLTNRLLVGLPTIGDRPSWTSKLTSLQGEHVILVFDTLSFFNAWLLYKLPATMLC